MMNLIWKILIGLFILDVVKKKFEKPRVNVIKKNESTPNANIQSIEPAYPQDETEEEDEEFPDNIDTSLDDEEEIKLKAKAKGKGKLKHNEEDDEEEEEEIEEEKPVKSKKKKTKKKNGKKKTITISYCKTTHQKYFDQFKLEMMGNYTNYEFVGVEHPVSPQKQFFSKFTFFSQIGVSILIFSGVKAKQYLPFIPEAIFDQIEKNKWMVMIGNYFLHSYLKGYLSSSYAFEVSIDGISLWSKLATNTLPKVGDIGRILKQRGL